MLELYSNNSVTIYGTVCEVTVTGFHNIKAQNILTYGEILRIVS
jgi:hypothetical protein